MQVELNPSDVTNIVAALDLEYVKALDNARNTSQQIARDFWTDKAAEISITISKLIK